VVVETFAAAHSQAVSEAHGAATGVFGGMLDRQAQVDRIKGVLAMLKRYESLFRLPTRIRRGWAANPNLLNGTL
jgi:Exocyst complex component Sec5